jgi:AraC family transcriptional regulator
MKPKFSQRPAMKVVGIGGTFTSETRAKIPELWMQFIPRLADVGGAVSMVTYGVCFPPNEDGEFEYIAAIEVEEGNSVPDGMVLRQVPAHRYAVFRHEVTSSNLHQDLQPTMAFIWEEWAKSGQEVIARAPDFELYPADFDPGRPGSWIDIYVPIEGS